MREIARQIESELEKRGIELSLQKEGDLTREVLDSFTQNELRFAVLRTTAKRCRRDRITVEEAQEIVQNEDLVESPTESNSEAERLKPAKSSITKSWARKHQIDSCQEVERSASQPAEVSENKSHSADKKSVSEYTYTDAESSDPDSQAATSSAAVAKPSSAASSKAVAKPSSVTERSSAVQAEAAASSALPDLEALQRTVASSALRAEATEPDAEPEEEDFQEESTSLSPSETEPPAAIHEEPLHEEPAHEEPAAGWVDRRDRNRLGDIVYSRSTQTTKNSPSSPTDTGAGTSGGESPSSGYFRRREVKRLRGLRLELEKNIDAEIEDLEAQEKASQAKKSSSSAIPAEASSATQAEAESSSATQAEAKSKAVEREV